MTVATRAQPDQQPCLWDDHVPAYEEVLEPLTTAFARRALDRLALPPRARLVDIGAGAGGAALIAAERGLEVTAIDASRAMIERVRARAERAGLANVRAEVMDATALDLPDAELDGAISVFGVILIADVEAALREMVRVLKPEGRAAIVTWTEIHRYELGRRLAEAVAAVRPAEEAPPLPVLPAQLRFREAPVFRAVLSSAGFVVEGIMPMEERWRLPSARWLADRLGFAPGMEAQLAALGDRREAAVSIFVRDLERDAGTGPIELVAVAHAGIVRKS